jgi:SAM-dependent methyltransferase
MKNKTDDTIIDFGEQWKHYTDNKGFYGSLELLKDILHPLLSIDEIKNSGVIEIGSGTGRIVQMLLDAGVMRVVAVEPSEAFDVLKRNTFMVSDKLELLHIKGEDLSYQDTFDFAFSIGVIHHIVDPVPVIKAVYNSLRPGGRFFVWVYGQEGNEFYLSLILPLRLLTPHLPHCILVGLVWFLDFFLVAYMKLCNFFPLPLKDYLLKVLKNFSPEKRRLVIYDQLNPSHAKYYRLEELEQLLSRGGFEDIKIYNRHGYSYSAVGSKPLKVGK